MAEFEFPVERTAILDFAAALGETNPIYWDEARARTTPLGGVIAPPTFAVTSAHWNPSHAFRGVRRIPAPAPGGADEAQGERAGRARGEGGPANLSRVLHGEQRFVYHQAIRPGMRLRVAMKPGRSWEKEGKRGGKLHFAEEVTEYRDGAGELVLVATSTSVITGKAVDQ